MTENRVPSHKGIQNFTIIVILGIHESCDFALFGLLREVFEKRGALST